jgi:hypothetical protein
MQEPFSELMRVGRIEGAERRLRNHLRNSGEEVRSIKEESSQRTERNVPRQHVHPQRRGEDHGDRARHGGEVEAEGLEKRLTIRSHLIRSD